MILLAPQAAAPDGAGCAGHEQRVVVWPLWVGHRRALRQPAVGIDWTDCGAQGVGLTGARSHLHTRRRTASRRKAGISHAQLTEPCFDVDCAPRRLQSRHEPRRLTVNDALSTALSRQRSALQPGRTARQAMHRAGRKEVAGGRTGVAPRPLQSPVMGNSTQASRPCSSQASKKAAGVQPAPPQLQHRCRVDRGSNASQAGRHSSASGPPVSVHGGSRLRADSSHCTSRKRDGRARQHQLHHLSLGGRTGAAC